MVGVGAAVPGSRLPDATGVTEVEGSSRRATVWERRLVPPDWTVVEEEGSREFEPPLLVDRGGLTVEGLNKTELLAGGGGFLGGCCQ